MKALILNSDNIATGRYCGGAKELPSNYIQVENFDNLGKKYIDGEFVDIVEPFDLEAYKLQAIQAVNKAIDALYQDGLSQYSHTEQSTFENQERDYLNYQIDPTANTPTVDKMVEGIVSKMVELGQSADFEAIKADLMVRIGENVDKRAVTIGEKQVYARIIKAATTKEEVDNVLLVIEAMQS